MWWENVTPLPRHLHLFLKPTGTKLWLVQGLFWIFFSVRLLSDLRDHSAFSSTPQRPMTSDFEGFLYTILSITLFFLSYFLRKSQYLPFQCWVLNKWTTGTIFIMSWYDAVLDWELNPGPPALEASTLPLGFQGGGVQGMKPRNQSSSKCYSIKK